MELSYRQLCALVAIAEKGKISRAAIELSMSQPSLSRVLTQIEKKLCARLFERSSRGVQATEAGLRVCAHAREIIRGYASIHQCVKELDGRLAGDVCVAMPESVGNFLYIHLIKHFKERHPHVGLRVMFSRTPTIPHYVEIGTADVAIVDEQGLSGLGVTPLMTEQFHLIGLPTPGAETRTTIKLQDVATLPLVLPALKGSIRAFIDQTFAKQGLRPIVEFEVDSASALLELVQDGWGYTILPYSMVHRSVMKDEVEARLITHSPIERMLWTALPANRPSSRLLRAVEAEIVALARKHGMTAKWIPATGTA